MHRVEAVHGEEDDENDGTGWREDSSPTLFNEIEEWRRQQPKIPPRPEAIRLIIEKGLAAFRADADKPKGGRKP